MVIKTTKADERAIRKFTWNYTYPGYDKEIWVGDGFEAGRLSERKRVLALVRRMIKETPNPVHKYAFGRIINRIRGKNEL